MKENLIFFLFPEVSDSEIEEINNLFRDQATPLEINADNWIKFYRSLTKRCYLLPDLVSKFKKFIFK